MTRPIAVKGASAVVDQGIFSLSGLALNVLLARWMAPAAYGAVAIGFSAFFFLIGIHNAIQLEPVSVLGPARYADRLGAYLRRQLRLHLALTSALGLPLALAGVLLIGLKAEPLLGEALVGAGLATPAILLHWTARRVHYVLGRPTACIPAGLLHLGLLPALLLAARSLDLLSPLSAFLSVGLSSLAASLNLLRRAARAAPGWLGQEAPPARELLEEQWRYGRWLLLSTILLNAGTSVQIFLAAASLGLEAAAALRAVTIPMLPMTHTVAAISTMMLPTLALEYGRGNMRALRRQGIGTTLVLSGLALAYGIFLLLGAPTIERVLFGGKYAAYASLIPLTGLVAFFTAISSGVLLMLRAIQRPQHHLINGTMATAAGLTSTMILVPAFGLTGAILSLVLTYAASSIVAFILYRAWACPLWSEPASPPGSP